MSAANRNTCLLELGLDFVPGQDTVAIADGDIDAVNLKNHDKVSYLVHSDASVAAEEAVISFKQANGPDSGAGGYAEKTVNVKRMWIKANADLQDEASTRVDRWRAVEFATPITSIDFASPPTELATALADLPGPPAADFSDPFLALFEVVAEDLDSTNGYVYAVATFASGVNPLSCTIILHGSSYPRSEPESPVV